MHNFGRGHFKSLKQWKIQQELWKRQRVDNRETEYPEIEEPVLYDSITSTEGRKAEQKKNPEPVIKKQASVIKPN